MISRLFAKERFFSRQMNANQPKCGIVEPMIESPKPKSTAKARGLLLSVCVGFASQGLGQAPAPPAAPATPGAPAAAPADLNMEAQAARLQTEAFAAFTEGKFADALAKAAEIRKLVNDKPFAQILYLEGACYFNMNDHVKAAETLQSYVDRFPDGEAIVDVRMALGRSLIQKGEAEKGVAVLKEVVSKSPDRKGEAGLVIANYYKKENKIDEALQILTAVIADGIRSAEGVQATLMAAELYVAKGDTEKASQLTETVKAVANQGESVIKINNIGLKLGDSLMEAKIYGQALSAYLMVRRIVEIVKLQKEQITKLQQSLKTPGKGPVMGSKDELEARLKGDQELLAELEKRTDYDASLFYRLGRCYFEMGLSASNPAASDASRLWQAILAFDVIVEEFRDFPQRDKVMFGTIMANSALKRVKEARLICEKFIDSFPDSEVMPEVSRLYGMLAYENKDLEGAEKAFDKALGFPKADKEQLLFLRGNVLFEMQRFEDGRLCFEILLKDFKDSAYKDDAQYRIALSYFYQNDFKSVTRELNKYLSENPKGQYVIDAKYRLAFIEFQDRKFESAMKKLQALIEESPNDANIGQVHALLADGFSQSGDYPKAMEHFALAVQKAQTEDVRKYAMDNVTDLYVSDNKWKELADMWQSYLDVHKDEEEESLKAVLWISRARVKEGKPEEAKKILAEAIVPKIGNSGNEQVEGLVQQLCSLVAPKRRRVTPPAAPTGDAAKPADGAAAPTPAAPPQMTGPSFEEVEKELEKLLTPPQAAMNGTSQMRILFARAWLAKLMKEPEKAEKLLNVIIEVAKPDDLSPLLLATIGDNARKKGNIEKAEGCYKRLQEIFDDSDYADGAAVGLAEIAFEKGEYDKALTLFNEATSEKYQGSSKLLDATIGKAKTLVKLKKYDDAFPIYETIAQTKEWRGEATAQALFSLGEIEMLRGQPAKAIPYFQRVFIAHQKWKSWVAKAYLQSAKCFLQLNRPANPSPDPAENRTSDRDSAIKTLQEAAKREDLKKEPEYQQIVSELSKLGL
jgi:tetratricopeptide (TPR) repeat protein